MLPIPSMHGSTAAHRGAYRGWEVLSGLCGPGAGAVRDEGTHTPRPGGGVHYAATRVLMLLCALLVSTPASAQPLRFGRITVYTRNLYIGTDFGPVLAALQDRPSLRAVAQGGRSGRSPRTNFPQRAEALAAEIEAIHRTSSVCRRSSTSH